MNIFDATTRHLMVNTAFSFGEGGGRNGRGAPDLGIMANDQNRCPGLPRWGYLKTDAWGPEMPSSHHQCENLNSYEQLPKPVG